MNISPIKLFHLLIVVFFFIPIVNAAMIRIDLDTMWEESDVAIMGTVSSIENSDSGGFFQVVEILVEEYHITRIGETSARIRIEGGEFGDLSFWVEDQPEFEVGERVFVFLAIPEEITGDYDYEVFGMYQGKWNVEGSTAVQGPSRSFELPPGYDFAESNLEVRELSLFGVRLLILIALFCVVGIVFIGYSIMDR